MSKIQLVTYNPKMFNSYDSQIVISDFNKLKALDNYEINIMDLSSPEIWANKGNKENNPSLNSKMTDDFKSIYQMINNSKKSKIIICLPSNIYYQWEFYDEKRKVQLKDIISTFSGILSQLISLEKLNIVYENSNTIIGNESVNAAFYFNNTRYNNVTVSKDSDKPTTIMSESIIVTSLNIIQKDNPNLLKMYLNEIGLLKEEIEFPEWLYRYNFNDDEMQNSNIEQAKEQIKLQKEIIDKANQKLQKNLYYKSILYNNSDALVEVVFEILEYIFDISLSDFNDEKREDFLFKKEDTTYIGEIKGVTSNVKYENISQLEVHYSKYLDKLQEINTTENIKKILIMNYERKKDILLRDKINHMQIDLAKKHETLIIDTRSLLSVYENILQGKLERSKVIDYIKNNSGLIELDKIV